MDVLNFASIDTVLDFAVLITSFLVLGTLVSLGIIFYPYGKHSTET